MPAAEVGRGLSPRLWAAVIAGAILIGIGAAVATIWVLQVALIALLGIAGFFLAGHVGQDNAQMARRIFLFAFGLRIVAVYVLHYVFFLNDPTLLAGDDLGYDRQATAMADVWRSTQPLTLDGWPGYDDVVTLLYYLVPVLIVSRLVNAFMGAMACVLIAKTAENIFDRRAGRFAGYVMAVFPSFLVWSSLNLKEALGILGITLIAYQTSRLRWIGTRAVPGLLLGAFLLAVARPWALFVGAAGYAVASLWALPWARARGVIAVAGLGLGIYLLVILGAGESEISRFGDESFVGVREQTTIGQSALESSVDLSSPEAALTSAPMVFAQVLLGPFPWTAQGIRQILSLPEVLLWYALLPSLWRGVRLGLRNAAGQALLLAGFASSILLAIVLVEGNLGLAFRHRLQAFVVLFAFVGGGMAAKWGSKTKQPDSGPAELPGGDPMREIASQ